MRLIEVQTNLRLSSALGPPAGRQFSTPSIRGQNVLFLATTHHFSRQTRFGLELCGPKSGLGRTRAPPQTGASEGPPASSAMDSDGGAGQKFLHPHPDGTNSHLSLSFIQLPQAPWLAGRSQRECRLLLKAVPNINSIPYSHQKEVDDTQKLSESSIAKI